MAAISAGNTIKLLVGAVVFGVAAAILSAVYLNNRAAAIARSLQGVEQQVVSVVVAKQDLQKGLKIEPGYFAVRNVPATYVHPNAIQPGNFETYYGRFLVENLGAGKPLLTNFINSTYPRDFSDLIPEGRRAITIQVDEVQSTAGMTRPGNKIDIYVNISAKIAGFDQQGQAASGVTGPGQATPALSAEAGQLEAQLAALSASQAQPEGQKPSDVILPVLQDIRVLATGREADGDHLDAVNFTRRRTEGSFTSMTVDVSPEQAALLVMAEDKGDLIAVLRNRKDLGGPDFTAITNFDLYANAGRLKLETAMRKAAAAAGATIDANGNWVTKEGSVIKKENLIVSENGTISTNNGQVLASGGVAVNAKGEYVDASGNVIPPEEMIVNADGTITTKEQAMLAAGYTKNDKGEFVDAQGNVVSKDDVILKPDGSITTKDEVLLAAGYTKNEKGEFVDAQGNVVSKDAIKVLANGSVVTAEGKTLSGPKVTVTKDGFLVAADGTVMTAEGKILAGATVNAKGEVVGLDGKVLKDSNLTIASDGTVRDSTGAVVAGVVGASIAPYTMAGTDIEDIETVSELQGFVSLIVGGGSQNGVARTSLIPVQPVFVEESAPVEQ